MKGLFDPGAVHQVKHSLIAISSGGVAGRGLGNGWEKTGYLPEPFNDFIFAIFAEEMGLIGVLTLLGLFAVFLHSGWRIARGCPVPALRLVAIGMTLSIVLQAVINIAVASAMAPTKGISLPFISHGSSGLVVLLLQVGILIGIARTAPSRESARTEPRSTES